MDLRSLLQPYVADLSDSQLAQVSTYLDLLERWNQKTNLTAIRDPQQIVTRHFGESFFLASKLFPAGNLLSDSQLPDYPITKLPDVVDLGSGAGFPAIPLLIYRPDVTLTLIEAHHTKAVFLREVLRALGLHAEVKNVRAESLLISSSDHQIIRSPDRQIIVTLRAVEKFESILPTAARLVRPSVMDAARPRAATPDADFHHGLALLISSKQIPQVQQLLPNWRFHPTVSIPISQNRVVQLVEPSS